MSAALIAALGVTAFFALILLHIPLAFAMMAVGVTAFAVQTSWSAALTYLASEPAVVLANIDFSAVPLFLTMGAFVTLSGFSRDLYVAAAAALGHRRGGLSYATIAGSAAFGSVCGSSPATVVTFTRVAYPEMVARGYDPSFSGATIAAGGALKSLIPPSITMIIYCVVAKVFIFDLFIAAVIPALLTLAANVIAIGVVVHLRPSLAPVMPRMPWSERWSLILRAGPAALLILAVFVGLYSGVFTVNEAASLAAVVSVIFALLRRKLTLANMQHAFAETAIAVGMLYFVLIGAAIFAYFINLSQLPEQIIGFIGTLDVPPLVIILMLLLFYLVLGSVFDEMAAMIVTLPIVLPIITSLGYDPIWWGVINVVIIELGLILPPVGIVVLIIKGMLPELNLPKLYRAVGPFILADVIVLALLTLFPMLTLWLPSLAQ